MCCIYHELQANTLLQLILFLGKGDGVVISDEYAGFIIVFEQKKKKRQKYVSYMLL